MPYYLENPAHCAASYLEAYIHQAASIWSSAQYYLFLTTRSPYYQRPDGKTILRGAGIDPTIFSEYLTRHASCSATYRNRVTLNIIREIAGWKVTQCLQGITI